MLKLYESIDITNDYDKELEFINTNIKTIEEKKFMMLDLVKEKSAFNMFNSIQQSKNRPLGKFVTALSIRHVGKETADIILLEKDLNVLLDGVMERKKNICKFNEIYKNGNKFQLWRSSFSNYCKQ